MHVEISLQARTFYKEMLRRNIFVEATAWKVWGKEGSRK